MLQHLPQSKTLIRLLSAGTPGHVCTKSKRHSPAVQKLLEALDLTHIKDKQTPEQTPIKWHCQTNKGDANAVWGRGSFWEGGGEGPGDFAQARQWGAEVTGSVLLAQGCQGLLNSGAGGWREL